MSAIPLHLQRRFEQRCASRFTLPVAANAPKNVGTKAAPSTTGRRAPRQRPKKNPPGVNRLRHICEARLPIPFVLRKPRFPQGEVFAVWKETMFPQP
jgi:hypothetical protein